MRVHGLLLAVLSLGCVRATPRPPRPGLDARAGHGPTPAPLTDAGAEEHRDGGARSGPPPGLEGVVEAVRRGDFRAAQARLFQLPAATQGTVEGRYLLARSAVELGQHARAEAALRDLPEALPAFATELQRMHARALSQLGRHAEARAAYTTLARRTGADRDRTHTAVQALQAGDTAAAAAAMRSWAQSPPAGLDHGTAWRLAAQALEATGDHAGAARAWRRLAVAEPDDRHAAEALAALGRLRAELSPSERLDRAAELVQRARYAEAVSVVEGVVVAPRGPLSSRRAHVLGRALYGLRTRYADAHAALAEAGRREDNPDRDEDAFLAARALARADRDDDAIAAFDALARGRRGRWADEAAYRAAWLEAHHQRVGRALSRLEAFLRERPDASARLRVDAAWEVGWMLYSARRYPEAAVALDRAGAVATHHLERGRGRYWAAMARWRGGDLPGANRGWQGAIADRPLTYYALLSEARLRALGGAPPALAPPPERRPTPEVPLPARALWLRALGFDRDAGEALQADEGALRGALPSDRADESLAVAYLSVGEARRSFQLSSRHAELLDPLPTATSRWVWDCGFPRPHAPEVEAAEDAGGMPRQYLFAIMRQESAFNAGDVSSARAIGLLQMIPPTTRRVAQTLGIEYREELLFEPGYNIRVGGWYIGRLFRQYNSVLPRAIGSFNAGPGAMNRWIDQWGGDDLDVFVERIPFDETRSYVKRVLQNLARYRYLHGPYGEGWPLRLTLSGGGAIDALVDY